jgi:hypothetical protein
VEQIVYPGEFEDWGLRYEHHGMIPFNYGDQDLGYLELSVKGAPVANILLTHRDGQPWQRPNGNEPLIQVGERGSFDDRIVNAMRNPPLIVGDEIVIPYNGRFKEGVVNDRFKGRYIGSLGLATLRLDGFAGFEVCPFTMHRYGLAASLQSQPVLVSADDLQVNLKGHRGTARVALLDEGARGIEGYGLTDCLPIDEDNVRATVRWKERNEIRSLRGRKVMFLIQLQSGSVWSFRL